METGKMNKRKVVKVGDLETVKSKPDKIEKQYDENCIEMALDFCENVLKIKMQKQS